MKFRQLYSNDYNQYLPLIEKLSKYKTSITTDNFKKLLLEQKDTYTLVLENDKGILVGCGSIFILNKLHTNQIGFIQDIYIDESIRKKGYGKILIQKLVNYANSLKCYKTILNCHKYNQEFYGKCGFTVAGIEMRI